MACGEDDSSTAAAGTGGGTAGTGGGLVEEAGTLHGLSVVNPACGTGDGGVGDECLSCASISCVAEYAACFDTGWQTSLVGGVCGDFGQCVVDCGCGDNVCFQACLKELEKQTEDACHGCLVNLFTCQRANCAEVCEEMVDEDGGTGAKDSGGGTDAGKNSDAS
jgi:hypothetical protein